MPKEKNKQVEVWRGILILMILFFHYTYRFSAIYGIDTISFYSLKEWGTIGVGCFFLISGFFLIPKDTSHFSVLKFLKRKILRIYPLYLICLTIIFVSVSIFGLPERSTSFLDYFFNVIMLNGFIGIDYVDGAHWYLTYLLIFYIIVAIYLKYFKNSIFFFGWLILKDLLKLGISFLPVLGKFYNIIGGDYIEFIILGIFVQKFYQIYLQNKNTFWKKIIEYKLELFLSFFCILQLGVHNFLIVFLAVLIFLTIFIFLVFKSSSKSYCYSLYVIGNLSYILYLIHQNIGYQILLALFHIHQEFYWYFVLITFLIILLLSYMLYVLYSYLVCRFKKQTFNLKNVLLFI